MENNEGYINKSVPVIIDLLSHSQEQKSTISEKIYGNCIQNNTSSK